MGWLGRMAMAGLLGFASLPTAALAVGKPSRSVLRRRGWVSPPSARERASWCMQGRWWRRAIGRMQCAPPNASNLRQRFRNMAAWLSGQATPSAATPRCPPPDG